MFVFFKLSAVSDTSYYDTDIFYIETFGWNIYWLVNIFMKANFSTISSNNIYVKKQANWEFFVISDAGRAVRY